MIKILPSKVHAVSQIDFTEYTYEVVYAAQNSQIILNGSIVSLDAGNKILMKVFSIEELSGQVFLFGNDNNEPNSAENLLDESSNNIDLLSGLVVIDGENIILVDNYNTSLIF